jgi:hypothetical protein
MLWNKISTFYHYKNMFINGYLKAMNGNNVLKKHRMNIIARVASINKIMGKILDKDPHLKIQ